MGPESGSNYAFLVAVMFLAMVGLVGLFDLWLVLGAPTGSRTVSSWVIEWSHQYPILPLLVGVLIGHLFFPPGS